MCNHAQQISEWKLNKEKYADNRVRYTQTGQNKVKQGQVRARTRSEGGWKLSEAQTRLNKGPDKVERGQMSTNKKCGWVEVKRGLNEHE